MDDNIIFFQYNQLTRWDNILEGNDGIAFVVCLVEYHFQSLYVLLYIKLVKTSLSLLKVYEKLTTVIFDIVVLNYNKVKFEILADNSYLPDLRDTGGKFKEKGGKENGKQEIFY